jgi:hypothetical protein
MATSPLAMPPAAAVYVKTIVLPVEPYNALVVVVTIVPVPSAAAAVAADCTPSTPANKTAIARRRFTFYLLDHRGEEFSACSSRSGRRRLT